MSSGIPFLGAISTASRDCVEGRIIAIGCVTFLSLSAE